MRTLDVSKTVTIRVYFSKSKRGPRANKSLGNSGLRGRDGAYGRAIAAVLSHWRPEFDPR